VFPLFTPVALLYFLIIMLSALELDFKLCVFSGTIAAIQFTILAWYISNKPSPLEAIESFSFFPVYLGTSALLFISGHTAGLVQSNKKRFDKTLPSTI
jgi:adenylate cyclase